MSSAKRLAQEILDTRRLALGHATSPQLTSSALDGGQLDINDSDGNRIGGLGLGDDGGFVIDYTGGPKPPKPSPPTVTADAGIFRIEWDGSFVNEGDEGVLATSDTDRVEIHASMDENFVPDRVESFGGAFATLDGGSFTLGPLPEAGTYYFRLVARSKSAQFSEPSDRVEQVLAITSIDLEITDAWLTGEAAQNTADGKNSIWRGPDEPEVDPDRPFKDGDVWFEMVDGKSIPNIWDETAGAWVANDDYRQSEIERVQQELRDELDTIVVDGSGTKNFYTPDMPTEGMREGDLWFDSSDKNKPYIYQDGEWITVRDQFVKPSTSLNVTDWGMLQPNMKAIQGQWSNSGYQVELETSDDLGGQSLGVVNIPAGDTGGGFITMPFQGVLSGSSSPEYSDDLFVNEGRPIGLDLQLLYNGPFQPSASQRALTAHYFADGELVDSRTIDYATLSREVFPAAPDSNNPVAFYANLLGYQFGMRVTGTVLPSTVASADEIALTVEIPIPAGAGAEKKLAVWSIDSRVQVPSTGLADGAVTETKVSDDAISTPKLQAGAIVAGKIAANAIETDHLDSKIVTTDKIAAGAITAESGIIGSINAGTITVGEMDGARIKAQTIHADKMLVGQGGNLLTNPTFANGVEGWLSGLTLSTDGKDGATAVKTVKSTATVGGYLGATAGLDPKYHAKVTGGAPYRVAVWVRSAAAIPSGRARIYCRAFTPKDGVDTSYTWPSPSSIANDGSLSANTWHLVEGIVTMPAGAVESTIGLYSSSGFNEIIEFCLPTMQPAAGATLIEGGAITTEHIRTGAITAESGIIGSIDANVITVGKIMGNQLDADAINGKTITGAKIRTASSGSRVELTHNGLKQYNALGQTVTDMSLGRLSLVGDIATGFAGERRVEIKQDLWPNGSGIVFASQGETVTGDLSREALVGSPSPGSIVLAAQAVPGTVRHSIEADPSGMHLSAYETNASGDISGRMAQLGFSQAAADPAQRGTHWGAGTSNGATDSFQPFIAMAAADSENHWAGIPPKHIRISAPVVHMSSISNDAASSNALFSIESNAGVSFSGAGSNSLRFKTNDGGYSASIGITGFSPTLSLTASGGIFPSANSGSGTNLVLTSDGRMARASSSKRYKTDIKPFQHETGVLDLELVTFRYQEDDATGMASDGPLLGVIAEDVAAAGVDCLVIPDSEGRPDGVFYDKIGLLLVPVVREQRDRIEALEARIAALEVA